MKAFLTRWIERPGYVNVTGAYACHPPDMTHGPTRREPHVEVALRVEGVYQAAAEGSKETAQDRKRNKFIDGKTADAPMVGLVTWDIAGRTVHTWNPSIGVKVVESKGVTLHKISMGWGGKKARLTHSARVSRSVGGAASGAA